MTLDQLSSWAQLAVVAILVALLVRTAWRATEPTGGEDR